MNSQVTIPAKSAALKKPRHLRALNRRRLVYVLLIFGALVGGGTVFSVYRQRQITRRFEEWRTRGLAADAKHDPATAVDLLGKYLARYPDDIQALICYSNDRLAVPLPDDGQIPLAIQSLRYAVHLDPSLWHEQQKLMQLYLRTQYWTESLQVADALLASAKTTGASDVEALGARATALWKLRRVDEAIAADDAWCDADPGAVDARLLRLDLAHLTGQPAFEADKMIAKWAQSPALSKCAADLLHGHARLLDADAVAARKSLTTAAGDLPLDPQSAKPLARDLDVAGLPGLALDVTRARYAASANDLEIRTELVRREWIAQHSHAVVELVKTVPDLNVLSTETLGLYAVALSDLNRLNPIHLDQIGVVLDILSARSDPASRAWTAVVSELKVAHFDADKLLAACGPVLQQQDGPILRYYVGESYLALEDRPRAVREWQRVVQDDPAWALPAIRLCELLTEQGHARQALAAGWDAARRAPHDARAVMDLAKAWASAIDAGQDRDVDGCLNLLEQLSTQLSGEQELPTLKARVLARSGRSDAAAAVIRAALSDKRGLSEQVWFDYAAASTAARLGLEQQCLDRDRIEHGSTARSAYARAVVIHFRDDDQKTDANDPGLIAFDRDRDAACPVTATKTSGELAWQLALARYLDVTGNRSATQAWSSLSESNPQSVDIQTLVISSSSAQFHPKLMLDAIGRLRHIVGAESPVYQLALARFDVLFGTTAKQLDEARTLLDIILHQSPESIDALMLSALANEKLGRPGSAIFDLRNAAAASPDSIPIRLELSRLLQSQGDISGGMEQLDHVDLRLLANDNQRQQAAALLVQQGDSDRAIDLLNRTEQSRSTTTALLLARLYHRTGQTQRALAVLDQLLANHADASAIALKADLLASSGHVEEARRSLDGLMQLPQGAISQATSNVIRAAFTLRYDGPLGTEQAIALLASAAAAEPANPSVWRMWVGAQLSSGHVREAVNVASNGLKYLPDDPALLFFKSHAAEVESVASDDLAFPLLTTAVGDPGVIPLVTDVLGLLQEQASDAQSIDWLCNRLSDRAIRYREFPQFALYRIRVYQKAGLFDAAVTVAQQAGETFPDDVLVLRAEVDALLKAGRYSEVVNVADKWKGKNPTDALDADLAAAQAMLGLNQAAEVPNRLEKYTVDPRSAAYVAAMPLIAQARLMAGTDAPTRGMDLLLSQGSSGRAAWMTFAVQALPADQALKNIRRAIQLMPADDIQEHLVASEILARLSDRTGNTDYALQAAHLLDPLVTVAGRSVSLIFADANWWEKAGDLPKAESLYLHVLTLRPKDPWATNNLAMLLARTGRAVDSLSLINAVIPEAGRYPDLFDTRALLLVKTQKFDQAIADIDSALRIEPRRPRFRLHQIQILIAAGHTADAAKRIQQFDADFADKTKLSSDVQTQLTAARLVSK